MSTAHPPAKISEILRQAIAWLHDGVENALYRSGDAMFSCSAIGAACAELGEKYWARHGDILDGLEVMGLNTNSTTEFDEFETSSGPTLESQLARALWLEWAALMAEEQGQ